MATILTGDTPETVFDLLPLEVDEGKRAMTKDSHDLGKFDPTKALVGPQVQVSQLEQVAAKQGRPALVKALPDTTTLSKFDLKDNNDLGKLDLDSRSKFGRFGKLIKLGRFGKFGRIDTQLDCRPIISEVDIINALGDQEVTWPLIVTLDDGGVYKRPPLGPRRKAL